MLAADNRTDTIRLRFRFSYRWRLGGFCFWGKQFLIIHSFVLFSVKLVVHCKGVLEPE